MKQMRAPKPDLLVLVAAALAVVVMMVVTFTAAAALTFFMVVMTAATAAAFSFIMMMVVAFAAAAALAFFMVVMTAATAAAFLIVVMVMTAATTAAFPLTVVMMSAAAATAASVVRTGQRNRSKRFIGSRHGQTDAFEHGLVLFDAGNGKAVFGLGNAHATGSERINGFLHEVQIARYLEDLFHRSFNLVEAALFVDKDIAHFKRTHFAETVFNRLAVDGKGFRQLDSFDECQGNGSGTIQNRLGGFAVERKKFRDAHCL